MINQYGYVINGSDHYRALLLYTENYSDLDLQAKRGAPEQGLRDVGVLTGQQTLEERARLPNCATKVTFREMTDLAKEYHGRLITIGQDEYAILTKSIDILKE